MERGGRGRESASSRRAWKPAATAKSWSRGGTSSEKVQNAAVNDPCDVPAIVGTCTLMCPGQQQPPYTPPPLLPFLIVFIANSMMLMSSVLLCAEAERAQRERLRDLAVFERVNGNPAQSSPSLAVKKV